MSMTDATPQRHDQGDKGAAHPGVAEMFLDEIHKGTTALLGSKPAEFADASPKQPTHVDTDQSNLYKSVFNQQEQSQAA